MSEAIELVFEFPSLQAARSAAIFVIDSSDNSEIISSTIEDETQFQPARAYLSRVESLDGVALSIKLSDVLIENERIDILYMRIFGYDEACDLEISCLVEDISSEWSKRLISSLKVIAIIIESNFAPIDWYAGLEPAHDKETRFFSRNE